MIREMDELLLVGRIARCKIRTEHLNKKTVEELTAAFEELPTGSRADQFAGRILDFVTDQTKGLEQVALGNTEVIESAFGKVKQLIDEDSKEGFTAFILSLAACMGRLDLEVAREALSAFGKKQVKEWAAKHVGVTIYSHRRRLLKPFKKRKKQLPQVDGGPNVTGIFSEQSVNF